MFIVKQACSLEVDAILPMKSHLQLKGFARIVQVRKPLCCLYKKIVQEIKVLGQRKALPLSELRIVEEQQRQLYHRLENNIPLAKLTKSSEKNEQWTYAHVKTCCSFLDPSPHSSLIAPQRLQPQPIATVLKLASPSLQFNFQHQNKMWHCCQCDSERPGASVPTQGWCTICGHSTYGYRECFAYWGKQASPSRTRTL